MKDITVNLTPAEASGEAYWRKRCDAVEAELSRLRAANAELVEALTRIRDGRNDPAIGGEEPELLEDRCDRYREWIRKDQDDAIVAISRAEQAKPEPGPGCGRRIEVKE